MECAESAEERARFEVPGLGLGRLLQLDPTLCEPSDGPEGREAAEPGPPEFEVYAQVQVATDAPWQEDVNGQLGVVFWREPMQSHTAVQETRRWKYVVYLPALGRYRTLIERHLRAHEGRVEASYFVGTRAEISYDVVVNDESTIVEGCVRLAGETWCTLYAEKDDAEELRFYRYVWENGIGGMVLRMPEEAPMNKLALEKALAAALGVERIVEVFGPDSMMLRP